MTAIIRSTLRWTRARRVFKRENKKRKDSMPLLLFVPLNIYSAFLHAGEFRLRITREDKRRFNSLCDIRRLYWNPKSAERYVFFASLGTPMVACMPRHIRPRSFISFLIALLQYVRGDKSNMVASCKYFTPLIIYTRRFYWRASSSSSSISDCDISIARCYSIVYAYIVYDARCVEYAVNSYGAPYK